MKIIIQIPCFNEEDSLPVAVAELPESLPGADSVEWLVVDDGSTDRTAEVAESLGVDHVIRMGRHQGLAQGFMAGIQASLRRGADIIVNTDADNQYCAGDIGKLLAPILSGQADIVIGSRPIDEIAHFSPAKRALQKMGSWVVRKVSGSEVVDAPSGFRAFSREAALSFHVFSRYSYTIETIIQAKLNKFRIVSVPVRTNPDLRPSRLSSGTIQYVLRSTETLFRIFAIYYPFRFFLSLASGTFLGGLGCAIRYFVYSTMHQESRHVGCMVLGIVLVFLSFILLSMAVLGDALSVNRRLLEAINLELRNLDSLQEKEEQLWEIKSARVDFFQER